MELEIWSCEDLRTWRISNDGLENFIEDSVIQKNAERTENFEYISPTHYCYDIIYNSEGDVSSKSHYELFYSDDIEALLNIIKDNQ